MAKLYRIKSRERAGFGLPCYVIRQYSEVLEKVYHQWAVGKESPSELPAREAMDSFVVLQRAASTHQWELEAVE